MRKEKGILIAAYIAVILGIVFILNYLILIPISIGYSSFIFIITFIAISIVLGVFLFKKEMIVKKIEKFAISIISSLLIAVIITILGGILSSSMFNSQSYRNLFGNKIKVKEFTEDMKLIDKNNLPVVNQAMTQRLSDKKIGQLGSQFEVDEFTKQSINGKQYFVAPLKYKNIFSWNRAKNGTPGYIRISVSNPSDVELITDYKIKYQPSSFFSSDLNRYVYINGLNKVGLTDFSFEVNDKGKPYFVITLYKNTIGLGGKKVLGIATIDPTNGTIRRYGLENLPKWIDRVYPADLIINQLDWHYKLIHGFWNFSNRDKLETTDGYEIVYNNGECFVYTGLTSAGSDKGTVGFLMTNLRTKVATLYKIQGYNEYAAMDSAKGKEQAAEYEATFPILINVENSPTYFLTLTDDNNLIAKFMFVNIKNLNIVGKGDNLNEALNNYIKNLQQDENILEENIGKKVVATGNVVRIGSVTQQNTTYFYIIIDSIKNKVFIVPLDESSKLPLTKEGDNVSLSYVDKDSELINVLNFENNNLK